MKFSSLRQSLATILIVLALLGSRAFAQTPAEITPEVRTQVLERIGRLMDTAAFVPGIDLKKWPSLLEANKDKLDAAKTEDEFTRVINETLQKFGVSHFFLSSPKTTDQMMNSAIVGIGITQSPVADGIMIVRTVPKAPADEAGLIPGDIITKVDGKKVEGVRGIAGPEGTDVVLSVKRKDGKVKDFTLTRRKFSTLRPEEFTEVNKTTAKITIWTFDFTYSKPNVEKILLQAREYPNLIVDLRFNGGGAVDNLQHLLGMLLPNSAPVGTFVSKAMVNDYVQQTGGKPEEVVKIANWSKAIDTWTMQQIKPTKNKTVPVYKGKIAVLINQFSGSASEIAAAALKDIARAEVVGLKSAGAVLVSRRLSVTNKFLFQIPVMDYVTVRGLRLEGNGVEPEVQGGENKMLLPGEKDEAIEKTLLLFERARLRDSRSKQTAS